MPEPAAWTVARWRNGGQRLSAVRAASNCTRIDLSFLFIALTCSNNYITVFLQPPLRTCVRTRCAAIMSSVVRSTVTLPASVGPSKHPSTDNQALWVWQLWQLQNITGLSDWRRTSNCLSLSSWLSCPGDPTVCTQNSASVSLLGCLLEEDNIDYTRLHLIDETCKGEKDEESQMVTFSFNSSDTCGAEITVGSHIHLFSLYEQSNLLQHPAELLLHLFSSLDL